MVVYKVTPAEAESGVVVGQAFFKGFPLPGAADPAVRFSIFALPYDVDRATPIRPGETCPPGMTEIRPRSCMGPEEAAPSILDYRPRSTLIVPAHVVKKARYPAIDFHGHPQGMLGSVESLARLGGAQHPLRMPVEIDRWVARFLHDVRGCYERRSWPIVEYARRSLLGPHAAARSNLRRAWWTGLTWLD